MYIIKNTFERLDGDPMLENLLGVDNPEGLFTDVRILKVDFYRSPDRSYGETFWQWESKETYDQWYAEWKDIYEQFKKDLAAYHAEAGLQHLEIFPDTEDQDWADPKYHTDSRINYQTDLITYEKIFE
jgi:hypothetical protein